MIGQSAPKKFTYAGGVLGSTMNGTVSSPDSDTSWKTFFDPLSSYLCHRTIRGMDLT
jgi:hypothetical protein